MIEIYNTIVGSTISTVLFIFLWVVLLLITFLMYEGKTVKIIASISIVLAIILLVLKKIPGSLPGYAITFSLLPAALFMAQEALPRNTACFKQATGLSILAGIISRGVFNGKDKIVNSFWNFNNFLSFLPLAIIIVALFLIIRAFLHGEIKIGALLLMIGYCILMAIFASYPLMAVAVLLLILFYFN